jgi:Flp pilus assembly protein TadD/glutathione synthase/RimK-type ligase-like ATP-grasp enzyme
MSNKHNRIPIPSHSHGSQISTTLMNQMVALYTTGQWGPLVAMARDAAKRHPQNGFVWKALGKALLMSGNPAEAVKALAQLVKIAPNDPDAHADHGYALDLLGRFDEAEKCYRRVLKINPNDSVSCDKLGSLYCGLGRFTEAEAVFRSALEIDPKFIQAHINLGFAVDTLARWDEAEACFRRALELDPSFVETYKRLGDMLARTPERRPEAISIYEQAIALNPVDANLYLSLGNILMLEKRLTESQAMFRRSQQLQPLVTWPARKLKADFSVLLLDAPEVGCTPVTYLVEKSGYESHFLALMTGVEYDIEFLRGKADVVINMISDADNGKDVLPSVIDIVDRIGSPTVNHPRKIIGTDRETIANLLSAIPLCRIPKTLHLSSEKINTDWRKSIESFSLPLLIRCAGTHGGDDFEKIDEVAALDRFMALHPYTNFYISEFVDYRSSDGYYRKYRLILINGEILPYHLAIHDHWLVHHFRTDMANQQWMRNEELAFLKNPQGVFNKEHYDALREVGVAIGLDYFGIDCSLDQDGKIVIFEANATMRVHDEKIELFAYKNPYVTKIKEAFAAMLARLVASR